MRAALAQTAWRWRGARRAAARDRPEFARPLHARRKAGGTGAADRGRKRHLVMKAEVERPEARTRSFEFRPQFFRRAVGDGRFAFVVVLLRHAPSSWRSAIRPSPRLFLAATAPAAPRQGVQGGLPPALVDGCPEGRADISLRSKPAPKRRSWSRTRKSWSRVARGCDRPLLDGSRESRSLPGRDATAITLRQPGRARCPSAPSVRLNNPLARRSSKSGRALGIALGGPRGMGNPPARWARYYRAHLVRF